MLHKIGVSPSPGCFPTGYMGLMSRVPGTFLCKVGALCHCPEQAIAHAPGARKHLSTFMFWLSR